MVRDAVGAGRGQPATKADLHTDIADLKADVLKVAIGIAIGMELRRRKWDSWVEPTDLR